MPSHAPRRFGRALILASILLSAFNLRTAVTSLTPLLDALGAQFGFGALLAGVFGMLPTAAFAVFGVLTPRLAHRIGLERTALAAMALAAVGLSTRGFAATAWHLLFSSVIALGGMGIGNVIIPPLIKRYFPHSIGTLSMLYLSVLQVGTIAPALLAVPMAQAFGWPLALGGWSLMAVVAAVFWIRVLVAERRHDSALARLHDAAVRADDEAPELPAARLPPQRLWRSPLAWSMALMFGMTSLVSYSMFTWLPALFVQAGATPAFAGVMVAVFAAMGLPAALLVPAVAARMPNPFALVVGCLIVYAAAFSGLLLAPMAVPWLWVALLGLGPTTFPLALTLVNLRTRTPAGSAALSGFTQGVGYALSCIGPVAFGLLHEFNRGWALPFAFLSMGIVLCAVAGWHACKPRWLEDE